jgi:hypothetical protein
LVQFLEHNGDVVQRVLVQNGIPVSLRQEPEGQAALRRAGPVDKEVVEKYISGGEERRLLLDGLGLKVVNAMSGA